MLLIQPHSSVTKWDTDPVKEEVCVLLTMNVKLGRIRLGDKTMPYLQPYLQLAFNHGWGGTITQLIRFLEASWYSMLRFTRLLGVPPEYSGKWRAWTSTVVNASNVMFLHQSQCVSFLGFCAGLISTLVTLMKPIT